MTERHIALLLTGAGVLLALHLTPTAVLTFLVGALLMATMMKQEP